MSIFEEAAKVKLRFETVKGLVSTEQLYDMPLTSNSGFSLNDLAKGIKRALDSAGDDDFVQVKVNPAKASLDLKMAIVKQIIATRQADVLAKQNAQVRANEREKLLDILEKREDAALQNLSVEEIKARLENI